MSHSVLSLAEFERLCNNPVQLARSLTFGERDAILKATQEGLIPPKYRHLARRDDGTLEAAVSAEVFVIALYFLVRTSERIGCPGTQAFDPRSVLQYTTQEIAEYPTGRGRSIADVLVPLSKTLSSTDVRDELRNSGLPVELIHAPGFITDKGFQTLMDSLRILIRAIEIIQKPDHSLRDQSFGSKSISPAPEKSRELFVRQLAYERIGKSGELMIEYLGGNSIGELNNQVLMTLPEASILRLVEQYIDSKKQPIPDQFVLRYLNASHTELLKQTGNYLPEMPPPYCLIGYARHFVRHIHKDGTLVPDPQWIEKATIQAFDFCQGNSQAVFLRTDFGLRMPK